MRKNPILLILGGVVMSFGLSSLFAQPQQQVSDSFYQQKRSKPAARP